MSTVSTATARRARAARGGSRDRGVASLELLGMLPLYLLAGVLAVQLGGLLWAVTSTNDAVRQGARELSLGGDGCAAARGALPSSLDLVDCTGSGGGLAPATLQIRVHVPVVPVARRWVPDVTVDRTAHLP